MKKNILITALILCCSMQVQAAEMIKGKIFTVTDTIQVTFKIPCASYAVEPNYVKLQEKVKYYDTSGQEFVLSPDQAVEIRFTFAGKNIRMLSRLNTLYLGSAFSSNQRIFLNLVLDGEVKLFKYYRRQSSGGMYNGATGTHTAGGSYTVDDYIVQKGNGDLVAVHGISFREDMKQFFYSCAPLVQMIEDKRIV